MPATRAGKAQPHRPSPGNWEKVSAETNAVGLVIIQTGSIVDQLAVDLAKIENALEQAAGQAAAHGVQVDGSGQPPQACYTNPGQEDWRVGWAGRPVPRGCSRSLRGSRRSTASRAWTCSG